MQLLANKRLFAQHVWATGAFNQTIGESRGIGTLADHTYGESEAFETLAPVIGQIRLKLGESSMKLPKIQATSRFPSLTYIYNFYFPTL